MRFRQAIVVLAIGAAVGAATTSQGSTLGEGRHDIDGDGYDDLVVGVPFEDLEGLDDAGAVNVLFGGPGGVVLAGNAFVSQSGPVAGKLEAGDNFGGAVEVVDIDGDRFAEVIVGASGEAIGGIGMAGTITVIPGSAGGLVTSASTGYAQGGDQPGAAEFGDLFGWDIASGDFDGDGFNDLVVAAPFEDIGSVTDAGGVVVFYGGIDGIDTDRSEFFSQAGPIAGSVEAGDYFGWSVAVGDLDGDGYDDLAVGVPGEDVGSVVDAGAVNVIYGSPSGLTVAGNESFSQRGPVVGSAETEDLFGFGVTIVDLDCDGIDDLAVSAPNEDFGDPASGGTANAGTVNVLAGSGAGVTTAGNTALAQGYGGVPGSLGNNLVGKVLTSGDYDGDGCGDLAFAAPVEDVGAVPASGSVTVVYGSSAWPTVTGATRLTQAGSLPGASEADDNFGGALGTLDVNGDGRDDLAVGVPFEDIGAIADAGGLIVVLGSAAGLTTAGAEAFSQYGPVRGTPEAGDGFASALEDTSF